MVTWISRRPVTSILRVVATAAMLVWLARHVHLSRLALPSVHARTALWLAATGAVTVVAIVLSALRWQRVLGVLEVPVRLPALVGHHLAGLFVSNFLPTTIGGDLLRASRLSAHAHPPRAVASVVLERLTGWLVLPVLTLVALVANPGLRRMASGPADIALGVAVSTLALLVVVLAVGSSARVGRRLGSSEGWRRFTGAVHLGLHRFRVRPGLAFEVVTVGFAYQLAVMLAAFLASKALGLALGWTAVLAFFPVVAIIQVLPLMVSGLGTREAALVFFLHPLGVLEADAFALGLLVYAVNLVVSLLGAPAFAAGSRPSRALV